MLKVLIVLNAPKALRASKEPKECRKKKKSEARRKRMDDGERMTENLGRSMKKRNKKKEEKKQ